MLQAMSRPPLSFNIHRGRRNTKKIAFNKAYMEFSEALYDWDNLRKTSHHSNEAVNETFAKCLTSKYGWEYWDLINATPYGNLHRLKNKRIEPVLQKDFDQIASQVDQALLTLSENRKRRAREAAYRENREGVAQHYQRLRSKQPQVILPPLPVFRRLPVVMMIQGSPSTIEKPANVSQTLQKDAFFIDRLETELAQWRRQAKKELGAVLGYPDWRTASTKILHPVERITARFLCKVCSKVAIRYRDDNCLDFPGACAHQCLGTKKDKKQDEVWKAERFVKDDKAIAALSKLLDLCELDPSFEEAQVLLSVVGNTILCTSCESGLVLNSKCIVGHSHRHEDMQMKLLLKDEAAVYLKYPFVPSLVRNLSGSERRIKAIRNKINFGCRHCLNAQEKKRAAEMQVDPAAETTSQETIPRHTRKKDVKRFSFNGLWSHLKEKHGITDHDIRDEDIFVFEPIDFKSTK
ncbi:hypothetical protein H0H81_003631 [Sphagnurus paluster]|uniref:Uncharacterized protein n=1 Tax=Sphagnurus paluster TaxID=117069 RepID=A0A9P7KMP6_9AGAR|nr:hypothetical protein H0H81_003631 [Sphagnurus paluster]